MTCKFVLKCSIREKLLVDNNELIKAVAEIFSVKIVFVFSLNTLYIHIYIYIHTYIYIRSIFRQQLFCSLRAHQHSSVKEHYIRRYIYIYIYMYIYIYIIYIYIYTYIHISMMKQKYKI